MNARQKLNQAVVTGALLVGGLLWLATGSVVVGVIVVVIILAVALCDNSIRLDPPDQSARPRPWMGKERHRGRGGR